MGALKMTNAQFHALCAVESRGSDTALRYVDTRTVMTLIAMAKPTRKWVTLVYEVVDNVRRIHSGELTNAGRNALAWERTKRAEAAERQRRIDIALGSAPADAGIVIRPTLAARVDPFDLVRTGAPAPVELPF
jgi:hypothetical protein